MVTVTLPLGGADARQPSSNEHADAAPPDDDGIWRGDAAIGNKLNSAGLDPKELKAAQLTTCEERLRRAMIQERPRALQDAIHAGGCSALQKGPACAKCRICPNEGGWAQVSGYYRANKGKVFICAEKEPSERQIEDTLTHELVLAYDHCRQGMRVPLRGWQAPWALSCAANACAEVRGYLLGSFQRHAGTGTALSGFGGVGGFGGGGGFSDSAGLAAGMGGELLMSDGNLGSAPDHSIRFGELADGSTGIASSGPSPPMDAETLRQGVYMGALTSISGWSRCEEEGKVARSVLDAVFDVCMVDASPLYGGRPPNPEGRGYPPMPPEVAAVDQGLPTSAPGGGQFPLVPPDPPLQLPPSDSIQQPKFGEA